MCNPSEDEIVPIDTLEVGNDERIDCTVEIQGVEAGAKAGGF